ncbi:MAG TPA: nucleotidyltransferase domain-containing protein [Candidatus Xenobia bacterium]|jgi:predicted nucleotidyltransferase
MPSRLTALVQAGVAHPPRWMPNAIQYETMMGSTAYGVSSDASDIDVYGFCIPPKELVFPHLAGNIPGFGRQVQPFEQYQQHHLKHSDGREYDFQIFGMAKYFHLAMENNPNIVDSLFTTHTSVLHCTRVGNMVREHRRLFLHRGCYHKFSGYAASQLHKMATKTPQPGSKRAADIAEHGFDRKYSYHLVRLLNECEQILSEGDLDLQRDREILKAVRRGEWSEERVREYFAAKERHLEELYRTSPLPYEPDEERIKALLLQCLEDHFGSLAAVVPVAGRDRQALVDIQRILDQVGL